MRKQVTVDIVVGTDGTVSAETFGTEGNACEGILADFEKALGTATKTTRKAEFFRRTATVEQTVTQ